MSLSRIACVAVIFAYFFSSFSYALLCSCATSALLKRAETTATQEKATELLLSMSQWYGHPRVLGVPIPKTLLIWASPGNLTRTITQIVRVIWEGDAHVTRVLGMEMAKTQRCSYHSNTGLEITLSSTRKELSQNVPKWNWIKTWQRPFNVLFLSGIHILLEINLVTSRP